MRNMNRIPQSPAQVVPAAMAPKGRKAPRADVDKMRESLAVYSEENTLKKIEERIDSNPEYIPKAIEVVQMLESEPSQSDPDKSSLLMEVFQMISDIAGSSALPLRSRQVVREEMREKHCTGSRRSGSRSRLAWRPPGKTSANTCARPHRKD